MWAVNVRTEYFRRLIESKKWDDWPEFNKRFTKYMKNKEFLAGEVTKDAWRKATLKIGAILLKGGVEKLEKVRSKLDISFAPEGFGGLDGVAFFLIDVRNYVTLVEQEPDPSRVSVLDAKVSHDDAKEPDKRTPLKTKRGRKRKSSEDAAARDEKRPAKTTTKRKTQRKKKNADERSKYTKYTVLEIIAACVCV